MHSNTKRELTTGIQYLIIGLIAEAIVLYRFDMLPAMLKMALWGIAVFAMGVLRFLLIFSIERFRRRQGMTITRRNWN